MKDIELPPDDPTYAPENQELSVKKVNKKRHKPNVKAPKTKGKTKKIKKKAKTKAATKVEAKVVTKVAAKASKLVKNAKTGKISRDEKKTIQIVKKELS